MKKLLVIALIGTAGYFAYMNKEFLIEQYETYANKDTNEVENEETGTDHKIDEQKKSKPLPPRPKRSLRFASSYFKAKNIKKSEANSVESLAQAVSNISSSDLEKAEIIYSWIAQNISYDDKGYNKGKYGDLSAEGVLKSKVAVCEGFSNLFKELSIASGLEAIKIHGYAKGYSYEKGHKFIETNHAWNAVKLNGKWNLVDVTWGRGHGITVNGKLKSINEFNDYWFCTKPEEFIYKHLPENKKHQLLSRSISLTTYETINVADKGLFELGFPSNKILKKILANNDFTPPKAYTPEIDFQILKAPISGKITANQEIKIKIRCPENVKIAIINNDEWTYLRREGNIYTASITPTSGTLKVSYKLKGYDKSFWTVLEYDVKKDSQQLI